MFNTSYGGIESDGIYRNPRAMEKPPEHTETEQNDVSDFKPEKKNRFLGSFFKNLEIDDLILIGIALLLLMDGDEDNDIFVFIIAALVFLS